MNVWKCGDFPLEMGRKTYIMGIVNATPDSFSGDGVLGDESLRRALQLVEDGADILDIGGESTRPGATPISVDEELRRVLPLLEKLVNRLQIPISVDTTKSAVARAAIDSGASIINDISAGTFDAKMLDILAGSDCGCVLMHLRGTPQTMRASEKVVGGQLSVVGSDIVAEVTNFWAQRVEAAQNSGIARARICLDAGFGFGKSLDENLEILRRGRELADFGFPVLSGTSRKSSIGKILDDAPVEQRIWGTAATVALAIANGADIVRVHDVKAMAQVARVADAITRISTADKRR